MPLSFGVTKGGFLGCLMIATAGCAMAESCDITFHLNRPGEVSVAVYDEQGIMFRELARGIKMDAGEHRLVWDGLDRYGQPAPEGEYEWRLLETPGFTREFLVNVGTNPGWTSFDLWPGNHTGPTSLLVDADTNLYVAAISSEGPPHLLKMSADGKKKFWDSRNNGLRDGLIGMARIGELVYLLFNTGASDILNAGSGNWLSVPPKVRGAMVPAFADFIHPDDADAQKQAKYRRNASPMTFAGGKDFLVVTYQAHDEIRFFWPKDEVIVRTNAVHMGEPKGCCVAPDGRVFVVSGKSVVRVNPETGEVLPLVTDPKLTSPTRIAYDLVNDDLLVVEHGENLDNVRRYHAADGKLIAVYGRPAGRTYGVFNPMDWGSLSDIAADNQGGFFTVEAFPRRVAHFRGREQLELVAQWFGGTQWGALCALDPADPAIVYLFPDSKHCARGRIDYTTRTWTLTHLYDLPEGFSWSSGKTDHRDMFPNFGGESFWEVRHVAGQTFLINNGRQQGGYAAVVRVDDQNNRVVPVAVLGGLHPTLDRVTPPPWWLAAMKQAGYDPKTGYEHFAFSWSDTNRNGRIDIGEIKLGSVGNTFTEAHCFVDPQWNVYCALSLQPSRTNTRTRNSNTEAVRSSIWVVVTNEGDLQMPIWNWDHAHPAEAAFPQLEAAFAATVPFGIFHDRHGNTYTVCNAKIDPHKVDIPPLTWPNNKTFASRFQKWNTNGVLEWSVGVHTAAQDRPPGAFAQVRGILGELHDCLVVVDACDPASVWTRDGLFAGSLYGQRADDGLPDAAYTEIHHADNQWGQILETPQDDILWGGMSANSTLIYRIHGWDNWQHQSGKLTIQRPSHPALWKGGGLKAEYFTNADLNGIPELQRLDPEIWFGPMWGDHQHIRPWRSLPNFQSSTTNIQSQMSVRWTGLFEAPLSESFTFVIYTYGHPLRVGLGGSKVRLWVNGELVIDQWDGVKQQSVSAGKTQTRACVSQPVVLTAGKLVPIRLEYAGVGGDNAQLHLFFSSDSIDLRHVPQVLLYPDMPNPPAK
jgi:hypothetical protein